MGNFHINILTLFPDMFPGALAQSLAGKAHARGDWSYNAINIRDYADGVHKSADDTPYGGGAGMLMRADVIEKALLSIPSPSSRGSTTGSSPIQKDPAIKLRDDDVGGRLIYLSPRGKPLTQNLVKELSATPEITLLCGRYEGVDQRILDAYDFEEISIGDYVLSGGEPAALILMDACIRLLPGVMGNAETPDNESFGSATGGLLEYPHYTRPAQWSAQNGKTYDVPEVLKNGNHAKIEEWRHEQSQSLTAARRPDLIKKPLQE